jgi:uncharacterized protein
MTFAELELADWRRRVAGLYAEVRADDDPERAHAHWRQVRDELIGKHAQSPALPVDIVRSAGVPYWPYDPELRFELPLRLPTADDSVSIPTDSGNTTRLRLIGRIELPPPLEVSLDVWSLQQYASGLFVPVRDGTAGDSSYGGGRYLLDTAKGADLGGGSDTLIVDLNFLYHPSCRYNPAWQCPLAPPGNVIEARIEAGERL